MAHSRLFPKSGMPFLSPLEALNRLVSEFASVRSDRAKGAEYVEKMVQQLTRMRHLKPPPASDEELTRLEDLKGESIFISISDEADPNVMLTTCVIPGQPLFFGYSSATSETDSRSLLDRCALALGYEIEDQGRGLGPFEMEPLSSQKPIQLDYGSKSRRLSLVVLLPVLMTISVMQAAGFFGLYAGRANRLHFSLFHSDGILFALPFVIGFLMNCLILSRRIKLPAAVGLALLLAFVGEYIGVLAAFNAYGT